MNSDFVKFLLDLDRGLRKTDFGGASQWWFGWERPWEPWLAFAAVAGLVVFTAWAYAERGRPLGVVLARLAVWAPPVALAVAAAALLLLWFWHLAAGIEIAGIEVGEVLPFLVPPLLAGTIVLAYRRLGDGEGLRPLPAALRLTALLLVLVTISGPMLSEVGEPARGVVVVLIDDSHSMETADVPDSAAADPGAGAKLTRIEAVRRALAADDSAFLRRLAADNRVRVMSFSAGIDGTAAVDKPGDAAEALAMIAALKADGADTHVNAAVIEALKRLTGQTPAGVVVISDGRSTGGPSTGPAVARARAGAVPVPIWTVCVGDAAPRRDVIVHQVIAEGDAYAKDQVEVQALVSAPGFPAGTRLDVRLFQKDGPAPVRTEGGGLPAVAPVVWPGGEAPMPVKLHFIAANPGRYNLIVRAAPLPGEVRTDNNELPLSVEIHERKLRVLYVEGYPRWEYRYLFPLLRREKSIEDSVLLLSSGGDFPQEGKKQIRTFPASPEELNEYDVVIFGDFDPEEGGPLRGIEARHLEWIADWVQKQGGGFAMIAGERFGAAKWMGTPIGKLLPAEPASATAGQGPADDLTTAFRPKLTERGREHPIFAVPHAPAPGDAGAPAGWDALPGLFWFHPAPRARPGADVLAEHPTARTEGGAPVPLVVAGQYGRGPCLFLGIDETWRWRYRDGEPWFDAFWLQSLRWLGRERLKSVHKPVTLQIDRSKARTGETVVVTALVSDGALLAKLAETGKFDVLVTAPDGTPAGAVELPAEDRPRVRNPGPGGAVFRGEYRPRSAGTFLVRPAPSVESGAADEVRALQLQVEDARREDLKVEADPAALAELQAAGADELLSRMGRTGEGPADRLTRDRFAGSDQLWDRLRMRSGVRKGSPSDSLSRADLVEPFGLADLTTVADLLPPRVSAPPPPASETIWDSKLALALFLLAVTAEWLLRKRLRMV